jgi:hypothetical protein
MRLGRPSPTGCTPCPRLFQPQADSSGRKHVHAVAISHMDMFPVFLPSEQGGAKPGQGQEDGKRRLWLLSTNGPQNNAKKMQWPVEPIGILVLHNVLPEERRKPTWWASVPATCGASSVSIDSPYRCFWVH